MFGKVLITYDLYTPGKDYKSLTDAIQKLGPAQRILESVWVVKTSLLPGTIMPLLLAHIDANDKLLVTQMGVWASQHLDHQHFQWMYFR